LHERELVTRMEEIEALTPLATSEQKDEFNLEKKRLADELRALGGNNRWKQFR